MTPALARLKRGVRASVDQCGGIDGAAATAERSRSVAGDWRNLNARAFPPLDCALALDEASIAQGKDPEIIRALARELGGVFVPLPDCLAEPESLAGLVMELTGRLGDISEEMRLALSDGVVTRDEACRLLDLQTRHDEVSAQLRMAVTRLIEADELAQHASGR
jgi:hypothetical protein